MASRSIVISYPDLTLFYTKKCVSYPDLTLFYPWPWEIRVRDQINRSNQQKNKLHVQHNFFLISKKTNLHVQHPFCLSLPLFCTTKTLFCMTKPSNFLVTHYFYGGIVVCAYSIFCLLRSCSLLFFTAAHFHLAGRQHFSLSHSRFEFSCFSSYKIRLFCFQSLALALSLLYP